MRKLLLISVLAWWNFAGLRAQTLTSARTEYIRAGGGVAATVATPAQIFTDAAFGNSIYSGTQDAAHLMYSKGITLGCQTSPPLFCVDSSLLRWQMAIFLIRAWSLRVFGTTEAFRTDPQTAPSGTPYFGDVPANHPAFVYIQKMYELGITSGCQATPVRIYCLDDAATNYHIAVFGVRGRNAAEKACKGADFVCAASLPAAYLNYPDAPSFSDITYDRSLNSVYQFAQQTVLFGATSPSIQIPGCTAAGYFCANSYAMRGQMALHIARMVLGDRSF